MTSRRALEASKSSLYPHPELSHAKNGSTLPFGVIPTVFGQHPNPNFINVAVDDYHLGAGSAAIDTGTDVGVTTDVDGDVRPHGNGFDIGYDESTRWTIYVPLIRKQTSEEMMSTRLLPRPGAASSLRLRWC